MLRLNALGAYKYWTDEKLVDSFIETYKRSSPLYLW